MEAEKISSFAYLPFLGILGLLSFTSAYFLQNALHPTGATVAMSTPVGGAIVFVPVLTSLDISATAAVAFGVTTQVPHFRLVSEAYEC